MSGSNSALTVMEYNHDDDESKSNEYLTDKQKFYAINQDIAQLIDEEQLAAATDGTSILSAITECKARALRLLRDPNRKEYVSSNIESSDPFLRSHSIMKFLVRKRKNPCFKNCSNIPLCFDNVLFSYNTNE